jgi:N-acyl-D-aspartate/D-glutamate deacylase
MRIIYFLLFLLLSANATSAQVDYLIINGQVYDGSLAKPTFSDIAIQGNIIIDIGADLTKKYQATTVIDAEGLLVAPGFIDPHTHSYNDLKSTTKNSNINYLRQGVTTVFNGNDGRGGININDIEASLKINGIGTNTAFFVGHGTIRQQVMGKADRQASSKEIDTMKSLVKSAMQQGAFGLSSGLYYVPGNYANTEELVQLALEVKPFNGVYESHIRDESSYNIGLMGAVKEAIEIGEKAGIPTHLAHLKALGVDVWGQSTQIIKLINQARERGLKVTADQYPWLASGTNVSSALFSRWVRADTEKAYHARLVNLELLPKIRQEVTENIRRRGGPQALLIVNTKQHKWLGKTLEEIGLLENMTPADAAIHIVLSGNASVASFNMNFEDVSNIMQQEWLITSSDGSTGHPRKFASYPEKYEQFVKNKKVISLVTFINQSSGLVADTLGVKSRGYLKVGYFADMVIIDEKKYKAKATYREPEKLSDGVAYLWVNGQLTINEHSYTGQKAGHVLRNSMSSLNTNSL